jgi:hypothetical protein
MIRIIEIVPKIDSMKAKYTIGVFGAITTKLSKVSMNDLTAG